MSILFLTQGYYIVYMWPDIIFQVLLLHSRPIMSHDVTYHVTVVSRAFFIVQKKNNKKRKIKIVSILVSHNNIVITLCPTSCCILEVSIVTNIF